MTENTTQTFVDTIVEAQKNVVDMMVENTRKIANGNTTLNETAEKGGEWYKQWLDNQKQVVAKTTEQATNVGDTTKQAASKTSEFYQNWYNQQMEWAKRFWDTTTGAMQNAAASATSGTGNGNPMEGMMNGMNNAFQNWNAGMQNWNNMASAQNSWNNWMQQMQSANPFNMDAMKSTTENWTSFVNQWQEMLKNGFSDAQKAFQNGTSQDAYRNMLNSAEGFTRFAEMMQPMWKSIQDKTFNTEAFKSLMNPAQYQELMDKYFGFLPAQARTYIQQVTTLMQDAMKQSGTAGLNAFQQFRGTMGNMMPSMDSTGAFGQLLSGYQQMQNFFQSAVSPIAKMVTPNAATRSMTEWQDIMNRMVVYSIKNSELQYMTYQQGTKVMDRLAENITTKIQNGEEIKSLMSLYQEWLNLSDATFVQLFESDEYSQLMAEVSGMQLRLKKDMENQMEKSLVNVPVATRSELDELYKTIYDLKKHVRELERKVDVAGPGATPLAAEANATSNNETTATANNETAPRNGASNGKKTRA